MKVVVLQAFTGYPDGRKTNFQKGDAQIAKAYIEEANLIEKGLIKIPKDDPET